MSKVSPTTKRRKWRRSRRRKWGRVSWSRDRTRRHPPPREGRREREEEEVKEEEGEKKEMGKDRLVYGWSPPQTRKTHVEEEGEGAEGRPSASQITYVSARGEERDRVLVVLS